MTAGVSGLGWPAVIPVNRPGPLLRLAAAVLASRLAAREAFDSFHLAGREVANCAFSSQTRLIGMRWENGHVARIDALRAAERGALTPRPPDHNDLRERFAMATANVRRNSKRFKKSRSRADHDSSPYLDHLYEALVRRANLLRPQRRKSK